MHPISQYVLKVHSRCDLACNHCYVYESADQSWRAQPRTMAAETIRAAAARIAGYAATQRIPAINVVLHGGEPLLMGLAAMRGCINELAAAIGPVAELDLRLQSNGVLLTEAFCELFLENDVRIGISLDGDRSANDRHRVFRGGASSHAQTLRALELLEEARNRPIYAGILCTVDDERSDQGVRGPAGRGAAPDRSAAAPCDLGYPAAAPARTTHSLRGLAGPGSTTAGTATGGRYRSDCSSLWSRPGPVVAARPRPSASIRWAWWSSRPTAPGNSPIR